ncbi:MAG: TAT-variant-translocated molybdopterin oxidoreductase [Bryobacteraceae bacterium]|nr:TAT-variant-translocated molybdopterin oxidoreductase [Bryobacteraceae bacterium]MDW8380249.1 TAT-variant-translocated molybdopterin oxidoreductase [Bryobacterales bacterium]
MSSISGNLVQIKTSAEKSLDLGAIREKFANKSGPEFWRSLEEFSNTPEFQDFLDNEFPQLGSDWRKPLNRRNILKLMGASLGLAGLTACTRQPLEKMAPYVKAPEEFSGNVPVQFASAHLLGGYAEGILVESHQGRPTKAEGNPEHPASLGATGVHAQAALLTMWDPDRSQSVLFEGKISNTSAFWAALTVIREKHIAKKGAGLRILTENITSPSLTEMIRTLLGPEVMPQAKWHVWDPITSDGARLGAKLAFGEPVSHYYKLDAADVIVSLDSDFLNFGPGAVRYAHDFAARRRPEPGKRRMNRLYVAEVTPTVTSVLADHRYAAKATEVEGIARSLAAKLGVAVDAPGGGPYESWVAALAKDLKAHPGASLVVAGDPQPPIVHALAHAMNEKLGNVGKTVVYLDPLEGNPVSHAESLKALIDEMNSGQVETLIILGANPVFTAPSDWNFRDAYLKVANRIHLGLYVDETAEISHWHVPEAHTLESWGDARAYDGTITTIQPLIDPIYGGRTAIEIIGALLGKQTTAFQTWKRFWRDKLKVPDFEAQFQKALHDGFWANSAPPPKNVVVKGDFRQLPPAPSPSGLEISFRLDPNVLDGRFANNAWLQELPKPISKVTWDNAVHIGPSTAEKLALTTDDLIEIRLRGRSIQAAVWVTPGQAPDTATITVGYGRKRAGNVGTGLGFDVSPIRTSQGWWVDSGADIRKVGRYKLVSTQTHHGIQQIKDADAEQLNRALVRVATETHYLEKPDFAKHMGPHDPPPGLSLYPGYEYKGYKWGMVIDLSACTGCQACVVACQAENNITVVGKDEVARGREMHWMRIDRYHKGELDNPSAYAQPVTCMHCENAPCEPVCPVAATVHSEEGINQMVYNRCVGTRYCANNCPYKVRRFNFFLYADWDTPSLQGGRNPEVTVRSRGVMEKCTYCIQRINRAKIEAEKEDRRVRDGEILTACQQVCPTKAIVFGDLNDKESQVAKLAADPRNYGILTDLNTQPRTTYLARVENPNPELVKG